MSQTLVFNPRRSIGSFGATCFAALAAVVALSGAPRDKALAAGDQPPTVAAQFPHFVSVEPGAMHFQAGDKIEISEVRGTAETFKPGHIYWIRGSYRLGSHDRATIAAYVTAADLENASSRSMTVQSTVVDKGSGEFTLFLPMTCRGWPHVSFYPTEGGEGFGASYFGTGDSVLKNGWWENRK